MILVPSLNTPFSSKLENPTDSLVFGSSVTIFMKPSMTPCIPSEFPSFPLGSQGTLPIAISIMLCWQYYYPPHWLLCFWAPGGTHSPHLRSGIAMCLTMAREMQVKVTCNSPAEALSSALLNAEHCPKTRGPQDQTRLDKISLPGANEPSGKLCMNKGFLLC